MVRWIVSIFVLCVVGALAEEDFSERMEVCRNKVFTKSWKPVYFHEYSFPRCREGRFGVQRALCLCKTLRLIEDNCPIEKRFTQELAVLHQMSLDGAETRMLHHSVHGCFNFGLEMEKLSYHRLFRCLSKQEGLLRGHFKLFGTGQIGIF